jgi:hypothetical protein
MEIVIRIAGERCDIILHLILNIANAACVLIVSESLRVEFGHR